MAETDVTESVAETPEAATSEPANETSSERPEADWSKLDALSEGRAEDQEVAEPEVEPEKEEPVEEAKTDPPFPSDKEQESDEEDEELDSINETLTEDERKEVNLPKPARRKLRALEKLEKQVLNPLKDPDTPIADAWKAISEFHPTRAQELSQEIAKASIEAYGDQWLSHIVGQEVTVESVKNALANKGATPKAKVDTPSNSEFPSLKDQPEVKQLIDSLTETYGEDWLDPKNDGDLLDDDRTGVQALRAQLAREEALQAQLKAAKDEIESLKPEVDRIKEAQTTEQEERFNQAFQSEVSTYRDTVLERAVPKVLNEFGITPSENDTDGIKAVKTILQSKFEGQDGYMSDFEFFAENQFSEKDNLTKILSRVGKNLAEAVKLDGAKQKDQAARLRQIAKDDQDVLTVLVNRAAKEFVTKEYQPILDVIEENADLKKRLSRAGRPEVIGSGAAAGGVDIKKLVRESDDPLGEMFKHRLGG